LKGPEDNFQVASCVHKMECVLNITKGTQRPSASGKGVYLRVHASKGRTTYPCHVCSPRSSSEFCRGVASYNSVNGRELLDSILATHRVEETGLACKRPSLPRIPWDLGAKQKSMCCRELGDRPSLVACPTCRCVPSAVRGNRKY
jgi:hypothetical protein